MPLSLIPNTILNWTKSSTKHTHVHSPLLHLFFRPDIKHLIDMIVVVMEKGAAVTEKLVKKGSESSASMSDVSGEEWKAPSMAGIVDIGDTTATLTEDKDAPSVLVSHHEADHDHTEKHE